LEEGGPVVSGHGLCPIIGRGYPPIACV
jgi:hypothetical protein